MAARSPIHIHALVLGVFARDVAARYGVVPAQAELLLERLAAAERLLHGEFRPHGSSS